MMRFRCSLLILFLLCCSAPAIGQAPDTVYTADQDTAYTAAETSLADGEEAPEAPVIYNSQAPSDGQWQRLTGDTAYNYRHTVEIEEKKPEPPRQPTGLLNLLWHLYLFFMSAAGRILLIVLLAGIVGYVLYRVLTGEGKRLFSRESRRQEVTDGETISEEDLLTGNWEAGLARALAAGDHRSAIRYSYMLLLLLLQARGHILYRQDKTNSEYYRELSGSDYRQPFRHLSRQYEAAWYGGYQPSPAAFEAYMQVFNGIKQKTGFA